jgi:hypothetical protein
MMILLLIIAIKLGYLNVSQWLLSLIIFIQAIWIVIYRLNRINKSKISSVLKKGILLMYSSVNALLLLFVEALIVLKIFRIVDINIFYIFCFLIPMASIILIYLLMLGISYIMYRFSKKYYLEKFTNSLRNLVKK